MDSRSSLKDAAFAQALVALKRQGCNLLVVGTAIPRIHKTACCRLLGEDDTGSRRRIIVSTEGDCQPSPDILTDRSFDRYSKIVYRPTIRSTAVDTNGDAQSSGSVTGYNDGFTGEYQSIESTIPDLGIAITESIDGFIAASNGLDPAELRVCVDSISPLVEEHGLEPVFRLLHLLTFRVNVERGMGHVHLPLPFSHELVTKLSPMFDACIELIARNGQIEHRWHLRDQSAASRWFSLTVDDDCACF